MKRLLRIGLTIAGGIILGAGAATAQPAAPANGHWEGTIQVPGQSLTIAVDLAEQNGSWVGTIAIPAQGIKGFALSPLTVDGNSVTFGMTGIPGDPLFKGTVSGEPRLLSGEFTQGAAKLPFTLTWKGEPKIEAPTASAPVTTDLEGKWEGTMSVQGSALRLVLDLANQDGHAVGTITSLDQGGVKIPVTQITQRDSALTLLVGAIGASYDGTFASGEINGSWSQGGQKFPLVFKRADK
jgi:hypothetical protein